MTTTLAGPCPTCHDRHPWPWLGHHPISSGHPEDDDPWCKHCGRPLNDMRSNVAADYCAKATAVNELTEPDEPPTCPRCEDHGIVTVADGGPDRYGNYDTDEIMCPEHVTPVEPDHDLHRCECDACHEQRADAGWVRNRNHR